MTERLVEEAIPVLTGEPLAAHTGLRVGGPADLLVRPRTAAETARTLLSAAEEGATVLVMGRGTNLLVGDGGFRGLVLLVGEGFEEDGVRLHGTSCTTAAGVRLHELIERAADSGLSGLEELYGIPGSVGGALAMNAGAYGVEIWSRVEWVELALPSGELRRCRGSDIAHGYRRADLPAGSAVVRAEFCLADGDPREIKGRARERLADRKAKHPLEFPNCGSVFKNFCAVPGADLDYERLVSALGEGYSRRALEMNGSLTLPAWRLVDACGLTGEKLGGAQISTKHSNFMVNLGGARAADFAGLIELARRRVFETFGVRLETEVRLTGEFL